MDTGTLYLVSTPIGNLGDMTYRAVKVIGESDFVIAEDTRITLKLLNYFDIKKKIVSYHKFNEASSAAKLADSLESGKDISLVSDAGTPLLSDPGYMLVNECVKRKIPVIAVPGASSILAALVTSGFDPGRFVFAGFLPKKGSERAAFIERYTGLGEPVVFFEAPGRVMKTLEAIRECCGDIKVSVAKEITKMHEKVLRGVVSEVMKEAAGIPLKGEYVIITGPVEPAEKTYGKNELKELIEEKLKKGSSRNEAVRETAKETGMKKNEVYKISLEL